MKKLFCKFAISFESPSRSKAKRLKKVKAMMSSGFSIIFFFHHNPFMTLFYFSKAIMTLKL